MTPHTQQRTSHTTQQRRHAAHHDRCERDARSEHSVLLCPLHQEEDTHAQEHAPADACARARLPPLRASMRTGSTLCSEAICAYVLTVATMPTASASAQGGAGGEGGHRTARRAGQGRRRAARAERGCLGLMGGRERALLLVQTFKGGVRSGPDSCKVRNSPGFLKSFRKPFKPFLSNGMFWGPQHEPGAYEHWWRQGEGRVPWRIIHDGQRDMCHRCACTGAVGFLQCLENKTQSRC